MKYLLTILFLVPLTSYGLTVEDSSGFGNNGLTVGGVTIVAGLVGDAFSIVDGSRIESVTDVLLSGSVDHSISVWVYPTAYPDEYSSIVSLGSADYSLMSEILLGSDGTLYWHNWGSLHEIGFLSLDTWAHVVISYVADPLLMTSYVDLATTSTDSMTADLTSAPVFIGETKDNPYGDRHFIGLIEDLRVYNVALSGSDVVLIYNGGSGTLENTILGLILWYKQQLAITLEQLVSQGVLVMVFGFSIIIILISPFFWGYVYNNYVKPLYDH